MSADFTPIAFHFYLKMYLGAFPSRLLTLTCLDGEGQVGGSGSWGTPSADLSPSHPCAQESTLKSVLSALWNLSAHSTENKAAICQVDGALGFLVSTLTYKCQSNSLAIIESGGGILRNVSSLIATREDYRSAPLTPQSQWAQDAGGRRSPRCGLGLGVADLILL